MRKTYYFDIDGLHVSIANHPKLAKCKQRKRHELMSEYAAQAAWYALDRYGENTRAIDVWWDAHGVRRERVEMEEK